MGVMTMRELCEYSTRMRKQRAAEHRRKFAHEGRCRGLTDKEYTRIVHGQKSSFAKSRKFTHHAMWKETHKKFDVQQLKLINKCTI